MSSRFEPEASCIDKCMIAALEGNDYSSVIQFNSNLLYDPQTVNLNDNDQWHGHWGTLIPFVRACQKIGPPERPLPEPNDLRVPNLWPRSDEDLCIGPNPTKHSWVQKILKYWIMTEEEANRNMIKFVGSTSSIGQTGLSNYERERSRVDKDSSVSRISPYLRYGLLSPRSLFYAVEGVKICLPKDATKTFGRRLFWRDLAYFQLQTFPSMHTQSIRLHYDQHEWTNDSSQKLFRSWCVGMTGYPMVDAAMRELWETGWMHQSMRMVVASFLVEFMGLDWRLGHRWFHDTLADADLAINSMMWQNAGKSGIDQWNFVNRPDEGSSRDPSGSWTRRWIPELKALPSKYLIKPWNAPLELLESNGVELGITYPYPIIPPDKLKESLQLSRQRTLVMRRANLHCNDAGGYDLITLPNGTKTRIFTRKDYRLDSAGQPIPQTVANPNNNQPRKVVSTKKKRRKDQR